MKPEDRLGSLSDRQRECLRLVFRHMSSKEIARALHISPHTVDHDLKRALRILGVNSRIEAARMIAAAENGVTRLPVPDHPFSIRPTSIPPANEHFGNEGGVRATSQEAKDAVSDLSLPSKNRGKWMSYWGAGNYLSMRRRLVMILLVSMGAVLTFALLVETLVGLGRLGLWRLFYY